jgi:hypothetical protein
MLLIDWIKQLVPCSINHSIESKNEIIKFIDNIKGDNAIVVIVNLNHEVICIILFFFLIYTELSYAI